MAKLDILRASLKDCPIVMKGSYPYFIHPLTDGVPEISPLLLKEVALAMAEAVNTDVDRIVTVEAMGIPLASALSLETGIPYTIVRKKQYGLDGEVVVEQQTGYSTSRLYINGVHKGDRVLVVDDVISTGGTLHAVLGALREMGAVVTDIVIVFKKGKALDDVNSELEKMGIPPVKYLLEVDVKEGKLLEV